MSHDSRRLAALAKIHVARKSLRLSDEVYRAIIARVTGGKRSSAALDAAERRRLLDELKRLGFQSEKSRDGAAGSAVRGDGGIVLDRPTEPAKSSRVRQRQRAVQVGMIRQLWRRLGNAMQLRNPSERGLRRFVRRQTGCDAVEWLSATQANGVIEGLKVWESSRNATEVKRF